MKRNNVDLICDVAELMALFERSNNLYEFLKTVVSVVAWHMRAAVCSIYIYEEETDELVMRANQGLSPDSVGRIRLKIGEGITGMAVKELRPIMEGRGSNHPHYRFFPGIDEERYEAFLAVPIVRGLNRVGALVVQDTQPDYFDEADSKALRAIAAQLATTIETAKLLMGVFGEEVEQSLTKAQKKPSVKTTRIKGQSASEGIAHGAAVFIDTPEAHVLLPEDVQDSYTLEDFKRALDVSEQQITALQEKLEKEQSDIASLIFSAHLLILKDEQFSGQIMRRIENGATPTQAISKVVNSFVSMFANSPSPQLKEKVHDIKDIGHRLLHNLEEQTEATEEYQNQIIVSDDLLPSDVVRFSAEGAEGLIVRGGVTSHSAILSRSLQIPMVTVNREQLGQIENGVELIMDADQGLILIEPEPHVVEHYEEHRKALHDVQKKVHVDEQTLTADGVAVHLFASINLLRDLHLAREMKAEGIGLYRSEFPFIIRNDFPSEEEQYIIYRNLAEKMEGKPVTYRTLDVGGDKMLSYYPQVSEANPFLGMRAIRFSLEHKDIFCTQLRALLRAGHGFPTRIMFPLVASLDDFMDAREVGYACMAELKKEGAPYAEDVEYGAMIELPSAIELSEDLAAEADFLSIGTNDLVQYLLAVDRTNDSVSDRYKFHHPAVLRAMRRISQSAKKQRKPLFLCGNITNNAEMMPFVLGIGIRNLSVAVRSIPKVQRIIQHIEMTKAEKWAEEILSFNRIKDVEAFIIKDHFII